ncbi:hypothetical protein CP973_09730 [Streptomyces albofaciens JCM 4342]|uniref:hypothetical protein n=1 Tax=Streptomyces albofaciens TaxID=66866 RepID=UPI0012396956|nr:hypothetical protein [Streptomyces albofaciens]KAA6222188.1 hypothetical protein CP973_09730 [Streptomyces albofaciens JCM 4342]
MIVRRALTTALAAAVLPAAALVAAPGAYAAGQAGEQLPSCYDVSTASGDYEQKTIKLVQTDADGPVVRGGGWRSFRATVTNIGSTTLKTLGMSVYAWRQVEDEDPVIGGFMAFEYRSQKTGKWTPVDSDASGRFVTDGVVRAGKSVTYDLRLRATADLPAHMTWADISVDASFVNRYRFPDGRVVSCRAGETGQNMVHITDAAASRPTGPARTSPRTG